jgi:hypothetical protein
MIFLRKETENLETRFLQETGFLGIVNFHVQI